MKIQALKRYSSDDYPNAPDWFQSFIDNINTTIDVLNPLLAHNIDIDNNLLAERQTVTLFHAVPITIKLRTLKVKPTLVRMGYAQGFVGEANITAYNTDGTFSVLVYFRVSVPSTAIPVVLVFEP